MLPVHVKWFHGSLAWQCLWSLFETDEGMLGIPSYFRWVSVGSDIISLY